MASDYIALPRSTGAPSTQTFNGLGGGMNVSEPSYMIGDNEARYMQDIILDQPGYIRRRGPITNVQENFADIAQRCGGFAITYDPAGNLRLLAYYTGIYALLGYPFTAVTGQYNSPPAFGNYPVFDSKASLLAGSWIGLNPNNLNGSAEYWRGGISNLYATGTISVARGSTAVTGVSTIWGGGGGNIQPGMFLFSVTDDGFTNAYIGVVASVGSNTSITLEKPSPYAITAKAYSLKPTRPIQPRIVTGQITTTTSSAIVTGSNTKFNRQAIAHGLGSGATFDVYRQRDNVWVGKVSSITNDTSLTLVANAAVAMNVENYYILNGSQSGTTSTALPGFLNAAYAQRQWFANNPIKTTAVAAQPQRLWFSETTGPEDLDLTSEDGNWIDVSASGQAQAPILGIAPAYNALIVLKENETLGVFGNTPDTFNLQKIADDGVLSPGSVQTYQGGVLWAGRSGIYLYDGVQTKNIVAGSLGRWYQQLVGNFDPTLRNMYGGIARDHYFLFIEQGASTIPIQKGASSTTPTYITLVINLNTMAVTTFSNFSFRGAIQMPALTGLETLFLVNTSAVGKLVSSKHIFDDNGSDTILCAEASLAGLGLGPDFYLETKKHDGGDSLLLKLWTNLVIEYKCLGDALRVDTVVGLNDVGSTINTNLPIESTFTAKRARFLTRSQHFAFRIWQNSSAVTAVTIGPYQLGFRTMRPGRI